VFTTQTASSWRPDQNDRKLSAELDTRRLATPEAPVWFKHRAWIPIAWLLSLGNLVAVWFAALPAEPWHATIHALLAVLFGLGAQRLMARQRGLLPAEPVLGDDRMRRLEQAIDSMAVELERIGEGQRFVTKLLAERGRELDRSPQSRQPDSVPASRVAPPDEEL
jgi:hypothetical protein